jgi:chromosome segregation ATPase
MSEAVILKLESTMHSLTERVGRHEDRLEAAINNMSNKLDALVEISRTMATLQERQTQHADGIAELKNDMREQREQHAETIREILVAHEKTVGRLHEHIDQLDRHIGSVAQEVKAAVAERVREEGAFHDKVTKLSHEWELRYAHSEKDQLNQTAEFAASLGALEKRFDNFFANVEGMKKMAYVLWAVMGGGVLLVGGKLVTTALGAY